MREVVDRRVRDAQQRRAQPGDRQRQRNANDFLAGGSRDGLDDFVDGQRRGVGELVTGDCRGRLSSTQEIDGVDDEVARHDVEAIPRRPPDDRQQRHSRLPQNPLHHVIRSVELLRLAGPAVADHHRGSINS